MKFKITGICNILVLALLAQLSIAADDEKVSIDCAIKEPYQGQLFSGVYESAKNAAKEFCKEIMQSSIDRALVDNVYIGSVLLKYAVDSEKALNDLGMDVSANYTEQFTQLKTTFGNFDFEDIKAPEFKVGSSFTGGAQGYFEPLEKDTDRFAIKEVAHCASISHGKSCKAIFSEFGSAFNPYRSPYNNIYDNTKKLAELGRHWNNFLEVSKSQTSLEVFLTTWANEKHFKQDYLVGPPGYQVIALHPQLIYDSMNNAPDGSNQELGLAVEWIGINFWKNKIGGIDLPLGISLASAYVDRADAQDVGHGFMLHIYNHYSIGWARHDDNNSVYVSIDLLKMVEDKKSIYDQYMKSYF